MRRLCRYATFCYYFSKDADAHHVLCRMPDLIRFLSGRWRTGACLRGGETTGGSDTYGASLRATAFCAVVYGVFLMCTSVLLWGGYLTVLDSGFGGAYRTASYFACGFALPVVLLLASVVSYARPAMRVWRHPAVALALVLAAALLLITQVRFVPNDPFIGALTGVCLGAASALSFCALQEMVASLRIFSAGVAVFAAAAVSAAVYLLVELLVSHASVWIVLLVFFPFVSVLCMIAPRRLHRRVHPMFQTVPANNHRKLIEASLDLWRPLLCVSFSAFLIGIIRADTVLDGSLLDGVNNSGMVGLLVASAVLLAVWRVIYARKLLSKLQLIIFPLIATAFLLLPFLSGSGRGIFISLAFTVFSITSSLMVVTCVRTARMYALPPVLVYGAFAGIVYLFLACGALLSFALGGLGEAASLWLFAVALVAVYVLSMALTLGKRATDGVRRRKAVEDVDFASKTTGAFANEGVVRSEGLASGQMQVKRDAPEAVDGALEVGVSMLERRCAAVAKHYSLTARETEVMTLLAHGRDVAFIAEELTLSKNTVRTHTKSVFSKMGVHLKQELIDAVYLFEE